MLVSGGTGRAAVGAQRAGMGYDAIALGGRLDHQPVDRVQLTGPTHGHRLDSSGSQCEQVLGRIVLQREHPR